MARQTNAGSDDNTPPGKPDQGVKKLRMWNNWIIHSML